MKRATCIAVWNHRWNSIYIYTMCELLLGAVLPTVLSELANGSKSDWTMLQVQGLASLAVVPDKNAVHRGVTRSGCLPNRPEDVRVHLFFT